MKLSIIGAGHVGTTLAFTVSMRGFVRELVLVGRDRDRMEGEALDLSHGEAFFPAPAKIRAGEIPDTAGSDILVFCASTAFRGETRLSLGPSNTRLLESLLPPLLDASPDALVLMVSNPVDVLTWQALRITGLPASRVFGTGTMLDSMRFRHLLSQEIGIHPDDLRAYILGEHGDSQFPAMSMASTGAEHIEDTPFRRDLFRQAAGFGLKIFHLKGHTSYGIAVSTAAIIESIALDEKRTMPLSVRIDGFLGIDDVCLSLPVVVGRGGIEQVLHPNLDETESVAFRHSAGVVRKAINACNPDFKNHE
jgi:L-lactate dehydrogenase